MLSHAEFWFVTPLSTTVARMEEVSEALLVTKYDQFHWSILSHLDEISNQPLFLAELRNIIMKIYQSSKEHVEGIKCQGIPDQFSRISAQISGFILQTVLRGESEDFRIFLKNQMKKEIFQHIYTESAKGNGIYVNNEDIFFQLANEAVSLCFSIALMNLSSQSHKFMLSYEASFPLEELKDAYIPSDLFGVEEKKELEQWLLSQSQKSRYYVFLPYLIKQDTSSQQLIVLQARLINLLY